MLDRNIDTKEEFYESDPKHIMKNKLSAFIHLTPVQLEYDDQNVVQDCKAQADQHVGMCLGDGEKISLVFPSKLREGCHVQVLTFDIVRDHSPKYEAEECHH